MINMKTAAAYIRVSTEDQIEYSPDSQLKAIRNYAKQNEIILPDKFVFIDEGISGRKADKRPAFQQMIGTAKLKPRPFDVILLWKFSRFARNREDSIVYKSMLRKQCGIDVISISEQLGEDKTSILIEALIEAMDEYYSVNLAEEVRRGMNEKFSRGEVVSQPPFGYKMGNGFFVPDEVNAPIVQMMFRDYLNGMGTRAISAKLNDMGIKTSKGNNFENRTVEYILTNPVYIGKLRRSKNGYSNLDRFHEDTENTVYINGNHKPIIDNETFELVHKKRIKNKSLYKRYDRQEHVEFMLKGLVRCSNCGATLTLNAKAQYLQCHKYAKGACKISHSIMLKKINTLIINRLKSDLSTGSFELNIKPREEYKKIEIPVDNLIEKEYKKLDRVREAYESGVDTLEEYKINKVKINQRIKELEMMRPEQISQNEIIKNTEKKITATLDILENPDVSETIKNIALREILDKIIFLKPRGIIEIFYKH